MRWLQPLHQSLDHRPRDTPLVEEKQLVYLLLSGAVRRRAMRYSALANAHMQVTPQKQELCDQPEWVCETSSYISLPPVPCYRKGCFTGSLLLHQLQGRKYFDAIKILLVFFTPSSSMQNRKAWHIAFYGYERSRWRFFVFSDNCAHNINTTLPNCTV